MLDEDEIEDGVENADQDSAAEKPDRQLAAQDDLAELIKQRFPPLPLIVRNEKNVNFDRIVIFDIYKGDGDSPFKIKIADYVDSGSDPAVTLPEDEKSNPIPTNAETLFAALNIPGVTIANLSASKFDGLTQISLDQLLVPQFGTSGLEYGTFKAASTAASKPDLSKILANIPEDHRVRINPIDAYPSIFDIKFSGPTALFIRSNIENFHFRPDPFHFRTPRDSIYYRNQRVSEDLKTISIVNAYYDGTTPRNPDGTIPREGTPDNQEHKLDFQMIQSQRGEHPKTKEIQWLMLPVIIDPPLNNGGGD